MKIILSADVKKLGQKGDLVEVSDGYARNYLIPKGLAQEATDGNIRQARKRRQQIQQQEKKQREEAESRKAKLEGELLSFKTKAGEKGRLFGAVTNKDLAEAIEKSFGIIVDKKKVEVGEPIKQLGQYQVNVRLYPQVVASMKVKVEEEEE